MQRKIKILLSFVAIVFVTAITYSNNTIVKNDASLDVPVVTLFSSEAIGEGTGAKYCRCKPDDYGDRDCNAANFVSTRPICQQGGGDCSLSDANC